MNKKGYVMEIIILLAVAFAAFLFFAGWRYGINLVNIELEGVPGIDNSSNLTAASQQTFGYMNTGLGNNLELLGLAIFFGYLIGALIFAYFSKDHPIMMFVYFIFTVLVVIFSVFVSNAYEEVMSTDGIGSILTAWSISSFLMLNLPYFVSAVGFFGLIFALIGRWAPGEAR